MDIWREWSLKRSITKILTLQEKWKYILLGKKCTKSEAWDLHEGGIKPIFSKKIIELMDNSRKQLAKTQNILMEEQNYKNLRL